MSKALYVNVLLILLFASGTLLASPVNGQTTRRPCDYDQNCPPQDCIIGGENYPPVCIRAWSYQRDGDDIRDGCNMGKVSNLFDIGGGFVNLIGALEPSLVYNTMMEDYRRASTMDHIIDLPYIIILDLGVKIITRSGMMIQTVTNVGPNTSVYEQTTLAPFGTTMKVEPVQWHKDIKFSSNVYPNDQVPRWIQLRKSYLERWT
ncbi:hypothetical protein DM860_014358 [Cuscuta australis]|uniref:Uncharacterized protein n=1 Tax=Cuscuta australis TaxID=267555 RepID=A0A328DDS2_9ASTE|nr:hypothetical protein DM860_014358 [Cuscuta australis]